MGQRHQIYFVLPTEKPREHRIVGLHHQWLYGSLPLRKLDQLLRFVQAGIAAGNTYFSRKDIPSWIFANYQTGDHTETETMRTLHAIYGLDLDGGAFRSLHALDVECADPRLGDNNDGITIVDLRKPSAPRFAFLFFSGGDPDVADVLQLVPMSARVYLDQYYDSTASNNDDGKQAPVESFELADRLDSTYKRLTLAQVRKLFPAMFSQVAKGE